MTHVTWRGTWNGRAPNGLDHQRARTVVRPTGGILRGKFPSNKTGRMVHHEGMLELDAIYHFETSPLVAKYTEQPKTVHYADGALMASPNSPTRGHPKLPQAARSDYDPSA